jgi:hypothetical protein
MRAGRGSLDEVAISHPHVPHPDSPGTAGASALVVAPLAWNYACVDAPDPLVRFVGSNGGACSRSRCSYCAFDSVNERRTA